MPFNFRSKRVKTPLGSFGFGHVFRWPSISPQQTCHNCGYSWTPRGRSHSIRCPSCGVRFSQVYAEPPQSAGALSGLVALAVLGIPCLVCGGVVISSLGVSKQPSPVPSAPPAVPPVHAREIQRTHSETPEIEPDSPQPFGREFTDKTGEYRTRAEFVEFKQASGSTPSMVTLRKEDGTLKDVPMNSLSHDDQEWIRAEVKKRRGK